MFRKFAKKEFIKKISLVLGGLFVVVSMTGCEKIADRYIESFLERKGPEAVEKVIDKIVEKRRAEQAESNREPSLAERLKDRIKVDIKGAAIKGDASASIVIVEFSDFQCPFCKRVLPSVDQVMKDYKGKVRLAFRHNPLPFHPEAMPAAKAAEAAGKQGKFWEMHDKLFENQQELSGENIKKWAKDLKLDVAKFDKDFSAPALEEAVKKDAEFARNNKAGGTPSFFIGKLTGDTVDGVLLVGAQPYAQFKEVIDALLNEKG